MIRLYLLIRKCLFLVLLGVGVAAYAQTTVSGRVTSAEDGSGLPGVSILEKGTTNGTVTDIDGNYRISVGSNATLVFSFVGFATQEVVVGSQSSVNVSMAVDVTALSEVVVTGYGTQERREITSSVVSLSPDEFNRGNVNDPILLLQGKVPGLSVYNRGGNPNGDPVIRLRGISTVGSNTEPLIVIDGVIGASLENVDPNDIASISVLKDGSAAAIYGSRASSGVILVTTKKGSKRGGGVAITYNGYVAAASVLKEQPNMSASEYIAAGGNNLGSDTDWLSEVTRTGVSNVHNVAISGGDKNTQYRVSTNFRDVQGILKESGFDQVNTRANLAHSTLDNRLKVDLNLSFTNKNSNFSFNEALRYAVLYNPTAPIHFANGDYYQAILFDNFNPVAIIEQNVNEGKQKNLNYNARIDYTIFDNLTLTANYGQQFENNLNGEYYSRNSLFRGLNRGGLARRYTSDRSFQLFEAYGSYLKTFNNIDVNLTAGYSFQEDVFEDIFIELGSFPSDELGYYALENAGDRLSGLASLVNINSSRSPNNQITAQFARLNLTFNNAIFFNASVRREGSTKLGEGNRYGIFPAVGAGVDILQYASVGPFSALKFRVGYGVTGSLPGPSGLAQDAYAYSFTGGGNVQKVRDANTDLKWEQKAETNIGLDFGINNKLSGTLDVYTRNVKDFILLNDNADVAVYPTGTIYQNSGELKSQGIELSLNYNAFQFGEVTWNPGIVLSSYKTTLEDYLIDAQVRGQLGAPGQNDTYMIRIAVGEDLGQIWGPVFDGVEGNGSPRFKDLNGDGQVIANPSSALAADGDFKQLGSGFPTMEVGFTNQVTFKNWDLNAFFRGAFGHSLINTFRAFYEPLDLGAINSYNRISTDLAVDGLTVAQYSSLYVEKADFVKLDNITLGYNVNTGSGPFKNLRVYFNIQNAFVLTGYTGIDPEPVLVDPGQIDNGGFLNPSGGDPLSPGIDRRNSYFTARTFTFGVNLTFN